MKITEGSGNVFADLALPNSEQELLKAKLSLQIRKLIEDRGLKQADAAKLLGIKQPHVSQLLKNRPGSFSVGRLIEFLTALGHDVDISVKRSKREHGELSVSMH